LEAVSKLLDGGPVMPEFPTAPFEPTLPAPPVAPASALPSLCLPVDPALAVVPFEFPPLAPFAEQVTAAPPEEPVFVPLATPAEPDPPATEIVGVIETLPSARITRELLPVTVTDPPVIVRFTKSKPFGYASVSNVYPEEEVTEPRLPSPKVSGRVVELFATKTR
jgi:hypothetical protein